MTRVNVALLKRFGVPPGLLTDDRIGAIPRMQAGSTELPEPADGRIYLEGILSSEAAWLRELGYKAVSADDLRKMLAEMEGDFEIHLNSPGGEVPEASAMAHELREKEGAKNCVITGLCASAATFILLASERIEMFQTAELMIHTARACLCGTAVTLREAADKLDVTNESVAKMYAEKSGMEEKEVRALMDAETYMGAERAKELGFVDEVRAIIPPSTAQAKENNRMESSRLFKLMAALDW